MFMMAMATDKVKVIITDSQKKVRIPTGMRMQIRRACIAVLREEKFEGDSEVSVTFVDNEEIRKLNKEFRNIDSATDVLSFPLGENGEYDVNPDTGSSAMLSFRWNAHSGRRPSTVTALSARCVTSRYTVCSICSATTTWSRRKKPRCA